MNEETKEVSDESNHEPMTHAQFHAWRKRMYNDLNGLLQQSQKQQVGLEVKVRLVWNAINAILKAFFDKKLVTDEEVKQAGADLMRQVQHNIDITKAAVEQGRPPQPGELEDTPMDHIHKLIYPTTKKGEANQ